MSARSLNKVQLIGNLTRDPELRYTPNGTAVCSLGIATNRGWTTEAGEKKEETEFHRIVAWNKLAELCSQLLTKGRKVYVEGRLQTRSWTGQDGTQKTTTEIVIEDMLILDSRREGMGGGQGFVPPQPAPTDNAGVQDTTQPAAPVAVQAEPAVSVATEPAAQVAEIEKPKEDINPDDIPF